MSTIKLSIDGQEVEVEQGATVFQAAREAGISIPTICDHKDLSPYGACRMCVVEIEGVRGFPTSCTTPATQGMQVSTRTKRLTDLRNCTLELLFSGHPNSCFACPHREPCETHRPQATKAGRSTRCGFCANREECDLREMVLTSERQELKLPVMYSAYKLERDDPFMDRDYNLCVLCGRCWRICEKIHGEPAISIINRGKWSKISTAFDKSHLESGCNFCGACIDICPTGTLMDRYARWQGKPEHESVSACILCPNGCSVKAENKGGKLLAYTMPGFEAEDRLCALGRFGAAQIVNSTKRLTRPLVREDGDQIPMSWDDALQSVGKGLIARRGTVVVVISATTTREERFIYDRLATALQGHLIVLPFEADCETPKIKELSDSVQQGKVQALITNGPLVSPQILKNVEFSLVIDCLESMASQLATIVLPSAILSEVDGTFKTSSGKIRTLSKSSILPGGARPEWMIICLIAKVLGLNGFDFDRAETITSLIQDDPAPEKFEREPRNNCRDIPIRFRGHLVADFVPGLKAFELPTTLVDEAEDEICNGFALLEKKEIAPNMHLLIIEAPQVARFALPGQFVILMAKETSERSPFTLADWDANAGTISLIIEEVGRSSRELTSLTAGDQLAHVSGPLGLPLSIQEKGTIFLGGGCYGIGAIFPLARILHEAGNRVICMIEAASSHLLYWQQELAEVCDELLIATKDGSGGMHGGIQEGVSSVTEKEHINQCIIIGCTFMMQQVSDLTKTFDIPTLVALNPIMVDGTGMCGACRVSIANQTQFACVDGPFFDGHKVDWEELTLRRNAYAPQEIQALPQGIHLTSCLPTSTLKMGD